MPFIRLSNGMEVHVRMGKRGVKISEKDRAAILAAVEALEKTKREVDRPCTCPPDPDGPTPCQHKYALSECWAAAMQSELP